jgi:hypothetical protein
MNISSKRIGAWIAFVKANSAICAEVEHGFGSAYETEDVCPQPKYWRQIGRNAYH